MSCGADTNANTLFSTLVTEPFTLPVVDLENAKFNLPNTIGPLYTLPEKLELSTLTSGTVNGNGIFDVLMTSIAAHLRGEYENNRITGAQYTEAYQAGIAQALNAASQFILGRDQAYWQAINSQLQARALEIAVITARLETESAKVKLAILTNQKSTSEAEYALTKLKLSNEDAQYCILLAQKEQLDYTLANILPKQSDGLTLDNAGKTLENAGRTLDNTGKTFDNASKEYNVTYILPAQLEGITVDNLSKTYTKDYILPSQNSLIQEQIEVQRAQTSDTRTNGSAISGSVGKQKDLYTQQIDSYRRDSELKAAKLFVDTWITQKTIDEGLIAPGSFTNGSVNVVLRNIRVNNDLNTDPGELDGET
jgi:hypothetical protein